MNQIYVFAGVGFLLVGVIAVTARAFYVQGRKLRSEHEIRLRAQKATADETNGTLENRLKESDTTVGLHTGRIASLESELRQALTALQQERQLRRDETERADLLKAQLEKHAAVLATPASEPAPKQLRRPLPKKSSR